jgi:DNA replication and repair protein RecF
MSVTVLAVGVRDFRTYTRAQARLGAGLSVVYGPNGAGKSNLLEAIYYGCTGRSPRTRNDRELTRFGASASRVEIELLEGSERHELTVGFGTLAEGAGPVKRMRADGAEVERLLDVPFRPLVSVFLPERLELVKGAPVLRRAHVDQFVAAVWPARADARREYARVLAQRNALLAGIRAGRASRASLSAWDAELARAALELRDLRARALELLAEPFAQRASALGLSGGAQLNYRPRTHARSVEELVAELQERLQGDLERGFSGHGPHRDEVAFVREGRELRIYGSQGEQRMALLALLLAERAVIAEQRGEPPLMLLDDVMSELDGERRELLARELSTAGQSVVASTDLAHVPGALEASVTRLRISPGAIMQEAIAA